MPDQYGYVICRSAMARRSVKYPLCLSVKLCVVIFICSALICVQLFWSELCFDLNEPSLASDDFGHPTIPLKP